GPGAFEPFEPLHGCPSPSGRPWFLIYPPMSDSSPHGFSATDGYWSWLATVRGIRSGGRKRTQSRQWDQKGSRVAHAAGGGPGLGAKDSRRPGTILHRELHQGPLAAEDDVDDDRGDGQGRLSVRGAG